MAISKTYNPAEVEDKWYQYWLDNKFFKSVPDQREAYTVVIPPPNVTGVLHMGHMLNNTIQDVLVRKARMEGKNACWVPGTDHASIATEAKVVAMLKEMGIEKKEIGREKYLQYAWEWKEKYGGIILQQLKKLGCSCDWDRTAFTMNEDYSESVIEAFVHLYHKGYIYRGIRMVNWDPQGKTALSDEEVIYKETNSRLYYIKYKTPQPPDLSGQAPKGEYGYETANAVFYPILKEYTKKHRHQPTQAEEILWNELSGKKLEAYKFRRQHIIGQFIADFVCLKSNLVIEIDGLIHQLPENKTSDEQRTQWLNEQGYKVIRFTNQEVLTDIDYVQNKILQDLKTPPSGDGGLFITIATVRPETILGDTAICVNPNDERYKHLIGQKAIVPIVNREIPIIGDEYVTMEFGTGALKVTPAHDINDYELGLKHNLQVIDTINDDGTLNENCGVPKYVGKDRFVVRKEIVKELEELGQLVKTEDYKNQVGTSERTGAVIEPKLSMQWFVKMKELSKPAWDAIMLDEIKLYPTKFKNMYNAWMENVRDWCISRQLWWGHQIPAYYLPNGEIIVAQNKTEALKLANQKLPDISGYQLAADRGNIPQEDVPVPYTEADLRQDEDVLDTWASSWLWPISVFKRLKAEDNADIQYYYPTNDLVTAPEILFFWVARMIIAGYEFRGEKPFSNVYLTGIVRDSQGRKMSKQLGNSPDPLELMKKYSTDGVRVGMLFSSPAGNDLLFDEKLCEQGRNFANKIWNSFRLIKGWEIDQNPSNIHEAAVEWFDAKFHTALGEIADHYSKYRISDVLNVIYKLFWDDFCSWYLEMIKSPLAPGGGTIDIATFEVTIEFFEKLLKILHPFMPFITEELWHQIGERKTKESICIAEYPKTTESDYSIVLEEAEIAFELITQIRNIRNEKQISPKTPLNLAIKTQEDWIFKKWISYIHKLANISTIDFVTEKLENAAGFLIKSHEFFIPLSGEIDTEKERERLSKELEYQQGFKKSIENKLNNEKFIQNAKPEIVENERKKLADAEAKIRALEEGLKGLSIK